VQCNAVQCPRGSATEILTLFNINFEPLRWNLFRWRGQIRRRFFNDSTVF
jgi:hypothetical protein